MAEERKKLFLTNVHLKGFKSIIDVDVEIKKGLNILIGKNGAGKSNFLECINEALKNDVITPSFIGSYITFISDSNDIIELSSEKINGTNFNNNRDFPRADEIKVIQKVFLNEKILFNNTWSVSERNERSNGESYLFGINAFGTLRHYHYEYVSTLTIKYNLPEKFTFITDSGSLKFSDADLGFDPVSKTSYGMNFIFELYFSMLRTDQKNRLRIKEIDKTDFIKNLKIPISIKVNLKKFTPIEDVRFNSSVLFYHSAKEVIIDNIKIEFKINGNWLPWSQLSDGTKRLFYMVAEITSHQGGLVLVEEPELGVHPHQFDKIMTFLKEQAEDKQIIVSTHSPQALNHLTVDELDHLIIAKYDNKKGTQIKHLTPAQTKKAKAYINKVGFFSDYWLSSDLE